jgi:3-oxoacyl-[acyl-carrier protein] reductase
MSNKHLQGLTILVTGAGRGLGHGIARCLALYGANVVAVARTPAELDDLASTVRQLGGDIHTVVADIGNRDALNRLVMQVNGEFGGVDALINNAAVLRLKSFVDLDESEFDETIEVNLLAPVRLIRAFLPGMIQQGRGAIINVTSGAATRGFERETDYCATKYGIEGFSYSLALELEPQNISVNLVTPGFSIKPTSVTAAEFATWSPADQAKYRDPIDMADAFAYLATQYPAEGGLTGKRFNAFALSEEVRQKGWDVRSLLPVSN